MLNVNMRKFLESTSIVDGADHGVSSKALLLAQGAAGKPVEAARRCYEFVRDKIRHSIDHQMNPVTLKASDVLLHRTGSCYSKCNLLVALLRTCGIPAGFCYQRLSLDDTGTRFALHGLVAAYLPGIGWYRMDARGNLEGMDARFTPPEERLTRRPSLPGEIDLPEIWSEPLEIVVRTLRTCKTWSELRDNPPDVQILPSHLSLALTVQHTRHVDFQRIIDPEEEFDLKS